jgi:hypothetical protein
MLLYLLVWSIFSTDKFYIEKLTRTQKEWIGEGEIPKQIIPEVFSLNGNIVQAKIDSFNCFIDDLIGLKRETYLAVIKVLRQYQDALSTINSNLELAYTMFVIQRKIKLKIERGLIYYDYISTSKTKHTGCHSSGGHR